MAKDPAFLFYPGDYLRDTQMLSEKTQVAYDRIMCEHMRNICISKQQLKFLTKRLNQDELDELMMVLTEINGGYHIEWVSESIVKRRQYSESRRKNRQSNKSKHMKNISKTHVKHMENENENENKDIIKSVIETLNELSGSNFQHTAASHAKIISARLIDGNTEQELIEVVQLKCHQWKDDPKTVGWLRPSTLFRKSNFENYIQEVIRFKNNPNLLKNDKKFKQAELERIIRETEGANW